MSAFSDQLWDIPSDVSPSWLHGAVCGLLCAAPGLGSHAYRRALIDLLADVERMDEAELGRFILLAGDDLAAPDLEFAPLLPDEDFSLADRLAGLAQWSDGFLRAFEDAGGEVDDEAVDALDDIARIADVEPDAEDDEDAEFDFASVVEHLRVAVLLVHDSTRGEEPDDELE